VTGLTPFAVAATLNELTIMTTQLPLAQHYHAAVVNEPVPLKRLVDLALLMDPTGAIQRADTPLKLPTQPTVYRTEGDQFEVLNARQAILSTDHYRLHPQSQILVERLTEPSDLAMARLFYQILEPARLFGEIDPLIHAAYAETHDTALLRQHVLRVRPDQAITTEQLVKLCGGRVRKSTINNRKMILGYTNPGRGCKARNVRELNHDNRHSHAI